MNVFRKLLILVSCFVLVACYEDAAVNGEGGDLNSSAPRFGTNTYIYIPLTHLTAPALVSGTCNTFDTFLELSEDNGAIWYDVSSSTYVTTTDIDCSDGNFSISIASGIAGTNWSSFFSPGFDQDKILRFRSNGGPNGASGAATIVTQYRPTQPTVQFSSATTTNNEDALTSLMVTLSLDTTGVSDNYNILVPVNVTGGTASNSGSDPDYTFTNTTFTIPANQSSFSFAVPIASDNIFEGDEYLVLSLGTPTNASLNTQTSHTITISNDETIPTASLSAPTTVAENIGAAQTATVSLDNRSDQDIVVNYSYNDGTAMLSDPTFGSDFSFAGSQLTIPAYSSTGTFNFTIEDDNVYETNESFQLKLTGASNASFSPTPQIVVIVENDLLPVASVSAVPINVNEGASASIIITLDRQSSTASTISYETEAGSASTTDYTFVSGSVGFTIGQTIATVSVPIADDLLGEPTELFYFALTSAAGASINTSFNRQDIYINDMDGAPNVNFTASSGNTNENTSNNISISLSHSYYLPITVNYTVTHTSVDASDLSLLTGSSSVIIPALNSSAQINFNTIDDNLFEGAESFSVAIDSVSIGNITTPSSHTHTINDAESSPTIQFTSSVSGPLDENTVGTHNISLSRFPAEATSSVVTFSFSGTTDTNDYTAPLNPVTFAAGETIQTLSVPIVNDGLGEGNETLDIGILGIIGGSAAIGTNTTHTVTISSNDIPTVDFNAPSSSFSENSASSQNVFVELSHASEQQVTVNYSILGSSTATSPADYTLVAGTLTFAPYVTTLPITINIAGDTIYENPNEYIDLSLSTPVNSILGASTHRYTILDDDGPPQITITPPSSIYEDSGPLVINYSLSHTSDQSITVIYNATPGANTEVSDFTALGSFTIPPFTSTGSFTITINNDPDYDGPESIDLSLQTGTGYTPNLTPSSHNIIINDDEAKPDLNFASAPTSGDEFTTPHNIIVSLSGTTEGDVHYNYSVENGTASAGSDYTFVSGTASISAGQTVGTLYPVIINDSVYEGNKTFLITLSTSSPYVNLGGSYVNTHTIIDEETPPLSHFTISGISDPTTAGNPETVVVTAIDTLGFTKTDYTGTITFSSDDGSATIPANYNFLPVDSGSRTFTSEVVFTTAGNFYLQAADTVDGSAIGSQSNITVNPGPLFSFSVSGISNPTSVGTPESVTVTAYDAYGNIKTNYTGTVTFSSDGSATIPANYNFLPGDSGSRVFSNSVIFNNSGTYYVQVQDDAASGQQSGISVSGAPAVTSVSSLTTDGRYSDGETILLVVTFDTNVNVTGMPRIELVIPNSAATPRYADYTLGSGTSTLTFAYTVQEDDQYTDISYKSSSPAIELSGGTIRSSTSTNAALTLPPPSGTSLSSSSDTFVELNPRPRVRSGSCYYDAYEGSPYTDCYFTADRNADTGDTTTQFLSSTLPAGIPFPECTWATINVNGTVSGTPVESDVGDCVITVQAYDGTHNSKPWLQLVRVHAQNGLSHLSVGNRHACAVTDKKGKCWGDNNINQLGNPGIPAIPIRTPTVVMLSAVMSHPVQNFSLISPSLNYSASDAFTCARNTDGAAYCWGRNSNGQLGIGNTSDKNYPHPVYTPLTSSTQFIDTGDAFACALYQQSSPSEKRLYCWGKNGPEGRLANNSTTLFNSPQKSRNVDPTYVTDAIQLSVGYKHSCLLRADGSIGCWGSNSNGQLGHNLTGGFSAAVKNVVGYGPDHPALKVIAGNDFTCAISQDFKLNCWGRNNYGQLGLADGEISDLGTTERPMDLTKVTDLGTNIKAKDVSLGLASACALVDDAGVNKIKCWGRNNVGQLGQGNTTDKGAGASSMGDNLPFTDIGQSSPLQIASAGEFACVRSVYTGATPHYPDVKCWGKNNLGQLGNGTMTDVGASGSMGTALAQVDLYPRIFITNTVSDGVSGIPPTNLCIVEANAAGRNDTNSIYAFVSTSSLNVKDYEPIQNRMPIMNANNSSNEVVASKWSDLFSNNLLKQIDKEITGAYTGHTIIWTGSNANGTKNTDNCGDWAGSGSGAIGLSGQQTSSWLYDNSLLCGQSNPIQHYPFYCATR